MGSLFRNEVNFDQLEHGVCLLRNALKSLRQTKHYECEDGWYSCPLAEDYISHCDADDERGCDCGADAQNSKIDAALKQTKGLVENP